MKPVRDFWLAHFDVFANFFATRSFLIARRHAISGFNRWLNVATGRGWNHILGLAEPLPNTVNVPYEKGKRTRRKVGV